jgi:nucleotide-binding universal stress UspA family protein
VSKAQDDAVLDPPVEDGVVAGFDGSTASLCAVEAAADEALRRGSALRVVRAWMLSTCAAEAHAPPGTVPSLAEVESAVRASVERAVSVAREGRPALLATGHVRHGRAAPTLIEAARRAELVVVARRGRGGFVDLILGSTADQVVRYAPSAVLVVRPPARSRE